jgi:hypothetical protein
MLLRKGITTPMMISCSVKINFILLQRAGVLIRLFNHRHQFIAKVLNLVVDRFRVI